MLFQRPRRFERIERLYDARPSYQPIRGVRSATPSLSRAEIGITADGVTPRPVRCAEIFVADLPEPLSAEVDPVHLVDDDGGSSTPSRCRR